MREEFPFTARVCFLFVAGAAVMENLSLGDINDVVVDQEGHVEEATELGRLCLVGRFLTDRPIRTHIMKERMVSVWRPGRGVTIKEASPGVFLFQFFLEIDIQRVLKNGPWTFDKHLLILGVLEEGCAIEEIPLYTVPF